MNYMSLPLKPLTINVIGSRRQPSTLKWLFEKSTSS
jgi:hypothetical protein